MRHLGTEKRKERGGIGRTAILAAFWTLIAVTLLSALAPLGPPLSRMKGSAFNPATSEVVLKGRTPVKTQAVQPVRPDDGLQPVGLLCLAVALVVGFWRLSTAVFVSIAPHRVARLGLDRAHPARAPPASF
ncbi:hypothetical protein MOK15_01765 [Sphingobium sp. BYY-5]|uniref:hypothetical protein n=1 Tax=Sphingobium sp. BYY-5 TaxID=2926400 RepID=UPI001FA7CF96|nr:hypothetical protein [Sphingobium sp. BYY-5]MCI4588837.1 hypothetical protein [Sphingobium sp. BYY-5]